MGGGGKGGGGSAPAITQPAVTPSPYEMQLVDMSSKLFNRTEPLRAAFVDDWLNYLNPQKVLREGAVPIGETPNYTTVSSPGTPGHYEMQPGGRGTGVGPLTALQSGVDQWGHVIETMGNATFDPISGGNTGFTPAQQMVWVPGTEGTSTQKQVGSTPQYRPEDYITQRFNPANIPGYTPAYDIGRRGLESQYNTAFQSALANTPRGGALSEAINQLNLQRAEGVGSLPAQLSNSLIQNMLNQAYGAAFNYSPSQAITGTGTAAQSLAGTQNALISGQAMMNAAQIQANAAANSGKGSGLGALGMGVGNVAGTALGRWMS